MVSASVKTIIFMEMTELIMTQWLKWAMIRILIMVNAIPQANFLGPESVLDDAMPNTFRSFLLKRYSGALLKS